MIHTIRKVKFLSKNSILTEPQHFHEFFIQIFLAIFVVKSKLSTAKKSKTTTFSRVFHPKKINNFSGNQSWIFGQKMKISNSVWFWLCILNCSLASWYILFEKSNCCPNIQFWQNFTIFAGNQSCRQLKSANPQHFHKFYTRNFFDNISREIIVVNS